MRVSINETDPGYAVLQAAHDEGKHCFVSLDGIDLGGWVDTADEEEGFVIVDVLNDEGQPQISPENPEEWWTERREGVVKVEFRPA